MRVNAHIQGVEHTFSGGSAYEIDPKGTLGVGANVKRCRLQIYNSGAAIVRLVLVSGSDTVGSAIPSGEVFVYEDAIVEDGIFELQGTNGETVEVSVYAEGNTII
jgi:hypothetical protein